MRMCKQYVPGLWNKAISSDVVQNIQVSYYIGLSDIGPCVISMKSIN